MSPAEKGKKSPVGIMDFRKFQMNKYQSHHDDKLEITLLVSNKFLRI